MKELRSLEIYDDSRENKRLAVGWDYEDDPSDKSQRFVNMLYVPYTPEFPHEHIELNREEAIKLRDWLSAFIEFTK
jgi:hypothetical protein